jgi:hypothetical protein
MNRDTESFLASVRGAEDPTRDDEQRVLAAVRAAVAGGVVITALATVGKLLEVVPRLGGSVLKGSTLVVCAITAAQLVTSEAPRDPSRSRPSPPAVVSARTGALRSQGPLAEPPTAAPLPSPPTERAAAPLRSSSARSSAKLAPSAPAPAPRAATAREELDALVRAQAAVRAGDGPSALRVLDAPGTDPRFAAERRALRILALCAAGRTAEARREAAAFLQSEPTSIQRGVVARSCAGAEVEGTR